MVDTIQAAVGSIKGEAGGLGTLLQPLSGPIDQVEKMVALGPEYLDDNLAYALYGTCGLFGLLVLSVLVRVRSMLMFLNCLLWRRVNIYIINMQCVFLLFNRDPISKHILATPAHLCSCAPVHRRFALQRRRLAGFCLIAGFLDLCGSSWSFGSYL